MKSMKDMQYMKYNFRYKRYMTQKTTTVIWFLQSCIISSHRIYLVLRYLASEYLSRWLSIWYKLCVKLSIPSSFSTFSAIKVCKLTSYNCYTSEVIFRFARWLCRWRKLRSSMYWLILFRFHEDRINVLLLSSLWQYDITGTLILSSICNPILLQLITTP